MSQPPPNGPYQGPPPGMPPQGPHTGGQPPMGPPSGGQPPMGPPPGGPYGPGGPGDPYGPGGPGGPGDPYGGQGGPYGPGDPYGYNPYGTGAPQPPQKKTSPWLFVGLGCGGLFVIGVILVVLIAFVFNDSGSSSGGSSSGESGSESENGGDTDTDNGTDGGGNENPDMPGMNELVEHDTMAFTVTGTEVTDQYDSHSPQGEYLLVHIDVASTTGSYELFWMDEQHVYSTSGEQFGEDYSATGDANPSISQDLDGSGDTESVTIVFDVPDAEDISYIGLSTQTLGGDETDVSLAG